MTKKPIQTSRKRVNEKQLVVRLVEVKTQRSFLENPLLWGTKCLCFPTLSFNSLYLTLWRECGDMSSAVHDPIDFKRGTSTTSAMACFWVRATSKCQLAGWLCSPAESSGGVILQGSCFHSLYGLVITSKTLGFRPLESYGAMTSITCALRCGLMSSSSRNHLQQQRFNVSYWLRVYTWLNPDPDKLTQGV